MQWKDEATGFPCLITRNPVFGFLCGYVGVPPGHPLYGVDVDKISEANLDAHGSVNYADYCAGHICHIPEPGEPDNVFWFGFDCGHLHDDMPGSPRALAAMTLKNELMQTPPVYRDLEYVKTQCRDLADQLAHYRSNENTEEAIGRSKNFPRKPNHLYQARDQDEGERLPEVDSKG